MKNRLKLLFVSAVSEVKNNKTTYIVLTIILVFALFVRVYRLGDLLAFYYDQGRDAKVIWRLWHEGKSFLVGPVTGLEGMFLGPFYYYLIAPFYLIGGGNPVFPAVFLASLSTAAIFFLYYLGWKFESRSAGLIAAGVGTFSYFLVLGSRWLANPTPLLLTSLLLVLSLWKIIKGKGGYWWIVAALLIGLSLQFEAASAVFFLPMIVLFSIWQRRKLPDKKTFLLAIFAFFLTLLPQIAFNLRHENILFKNFYRVLVTEQSFKLSFWEVFRGRLKFFWTVFHSKVFPGFKTYAVIFFSLSFAALFVKGRETKDNSAINLLLLFILTPAIGLILFQGNFGNIYDYYMTGIYLPFILLLSIGLSYSLKKRGGLIILAIFFLIFLVESGTLLRNYLRAGVDGPTHITLGNQLQAVNWVFEDADERGEFNVDVYVPPVIPHAYDYLFLWQGTKLCGDNLCQLKLKENVPLLYTLYEVDPPHPDRLSAWLERQKGIGKVEDEVKFGGITVQRRTRL